MTGCHHDEILRRFVSLVDRPTIENSWRGFYVEQLVGCLVGPPWQVVSADWAGHDMEHPDGTRVEIKQSAARQTWAAELAAHRVNPRFGIRAAKGYYEGATWFESAGRRAHIYIFAWHPVATAAADHRDELQWQFHVISAESLPGGQGSIGLSTLSRLAAPCAASALGERLEALRVARRPDPAQGNVQLVYSRSPSFERKGSHGQ